MKDGSSCISFESASPSFSWSAFDFGSIAIWITGSGNSIFSRTIGFAGSQRVCPVWVSLRPRNAQIFPAEISEISSLLFACISKSLPTLSFFSVTELSKVSPDLITPEYTLTKVKVPTKGSVMILKAIAETGSLRSAFLTTVSSSLSGLWPTISPLSSGDGKKSITALSTSWTPLFPRAVPQSIG